MNLLEEARIDINDVDREMAKLFEKRMQAAEKVIAYKIENNLPIFDSSREAEVIEKNCKLIENEKYITYYKEFIQHLMDLSKSYQKSILDQNK